MYKQRLCHATLPQKLLTPDCNLTLMTDVRIAIINAHNVKMRDPKLWAGIRLKAGISFEMYGILKQSLAAFMPRIKSIMPTNDEIIAADSAIRAKNLSSLFPMKLFSTQNGVFLDYISHLQVILKSTWADLPLEDCLPFFAVKDSETGYRLRTVADGLRDIVICFTLDGIAVKRGLSNVNISTRKPCAHLSLCLFAGKNVRLIFV